MGLLTVGCESARWGLLAVSCGWYCAYAGLCASSKVYPDKGVLVLIRGSGGPERAGETS